MSRLRLTDVARRLTPPFIRRSLRAKLVVVLGSMLASIALFASLHLPTMLERGAMDGIRSKAESVASVAAYSVAPALLFDDDQSVREIALGMSRAPQLAYVTITDTAGRRTVFRGQDRGPFGGAALPPLGDDAEDGDATDGDIYSASAAVLSPDGERIGDVRVGFWLDQMRSEVVEIRLKVAFFSMMLFLIGLAAVGLISKYVTHPVALMVRRMDWVAAGDLTTRLNLRADDELGYLSRSFDAMVEKLGVTRRDLQELNRTLEARVDERTVDLRREVDERKRAEHALRVSDRRFQSMFNSAGIGIALIDGDATVLESNVALRDTLGYGPGETPVLVVHNADVDTALQSFTRLLRREAESVQVEIRMRRADRTFIWAHCIGTIVSNPGEDRMLILGMLMDISEHKHLEDMYRQAQKLEAVGRLAGGIAHDFNNLLTTINGVSDILLEEAGRDAEEREDIEQIRLAGERAASLTRQLLAFSRRQVLQPIVLEVDRVIGETARMLRRLIGENIELITICEASKASVRADAGQFDQVLLNLVVNARDAMPNGGRITLATRILDRAPADAARRGVGAGRYVAIDVVDTGIGMDEATQARIFEPFFTTKPVGVGTGLGLATVYGIVAQSGGAIEVRSKPRRGSTFSVLLPLCAAAAEQTATIVTAARAHGNETILLVEDDRTVRALFSRVLARGGYTVIEATNGRDALQRAALHRGTIELVISDVIMPEMSGPEAVRRLLEQRPDLKVLFLSGYTEDTMIHQGVLTQAISYMQKPVAPAELRRRVREILENAAAAEPVPA